LRLFAVDRRYAFTGGAEVLLGWIGD